MAFCSHEPGTQCEQGVVAPSCHLDGNCDVVENSLVVVQGVVRERGGARRCRHEIWTRERLRAIESMRSLLDRPFVLALPH